MKLLSALPFLIGFVYFVSVVVSAHRLFVVITTFDLDVSPGFAI